MGIDAVIYAKGKITQEQFESAKTFLNQRVTADEYSHWELSEQGITFWDGTRFYGKGYERGYWPHLYALIRCFMKALPNCEIYYEPDFGTIEDLGFNHEPVTEESLQEIWNHHLSQDGKSYTIKGEQK